ncbi:hypothetical protein I4U23_010475 [Adineta vaga]|nr:hypothetical protein I4U23_010475 [Adineta vaga]
MLYYTTSYASLVAFSRSLSHAWITFLLSAIKLCSLYQMDYFMMIIAILGMLISFHNQTFSFIILCWSLFIERWIRSIEHNQIKRRKKKLLSCSLLIMFSSYAYYNSKKFMFITWIRPPWTLYYDLFFILFVINEPFKCLDENDWQPWHNFRDHEVSLPFLGASYEIMIRDVKYLYSSFKIQWLRTIIILVLYILPPIFVFIHGDMDRKIRQQYISSTMFLILLMGTGREIAVESVDKLFKTTRKIYLFSTWLLINIVLLIIYHYIYSFVPLVIFGYYYYHEFLVPPDLIEYAALFALLFIASLYRSQPTKIKRTIVSVE